MLDAYQQGPVLADIQLRLRGIDLLNRAYQAKNALARDVPSPKAERRFYALPPVPAYVDEMGLGIAAGINLPA